LRPKRSGLRNAGATASASSQRLHMRTECEQSQVDVFVRAECRRGQ
jgi:hypothetical protein